jgi:hypothetical protein
MSKVKRIPFREEVDADNKELKRFPSLVVGTPTVVR